MGIGVKMKLSWIPYKPQIGKLLKIILPKDMIVPILQGRLRGKIKIDVEGAELLVLEGAKSTLSNYSPKIFLATHSHIVPNVHIDCCNFLASLGYKLKSMIGDDLYNTKEIFAYTDDGYADLEARKP